jgi:hypothetical protein
MTIRPIRAYAAAAGVLAIVLTRHPIAAQASNDVGELAASMASAQRCLAARDPIAAANDIRSCSIYALGVASHSHGQAQTALFSASYALDSLADRIEMGRGSTAPSVTHSAFARTQYALAEAHADAAHHQWTRLAAVATGRELRLSVEALTASLAEQNRRADAPTAARLHQVATVADELEHGRGFTAPDVILAIIALHEALYVTRP